MCDRFSVDGFRTRAALVIRRRVLGVRVAKGKNRGRERERPGDVNSPGVAPLTWVLGRRASPVPPWTRTWCNGPRVPALRTQSAHLHTHTVFPAPRNHLDVPFSLPRFFPLATEPQYPQPDHPGGAGSKTIGRKPITHTKPLRFLSFYVCCVPPTYDTHTCIRFPLLLSRLPCITRTLVCVCVFSISLFRLHGARTFGTQHLNFPDLLSFNSAN